jgi:hypothetical protein
VEAAHDDSVRKSANDDDSAREAANENTSVHGMDKGMSRGEAEVANTNATEAAATEVAEAAAKVAEATAKATVTTEAAAKAAVTTPHHRCLIGARKIDTQKPGCPRLDCSER